MIAAPKRQYTENLLDGLRIYHNPFARHPLDPGIFRNPSVFQVWQEDGEVYVDQREGLLLNRFLFTALPQGTLTQPGPQHVEDSDAARD